MAAPVKCAMPDNVDINATYTLQISAQDAATGDEVSGVQFSNMSIEAVDLSGGGDLLAVGPYMLVPGPGA